MSPDSSETDRATATPDVYDHVRPTDADLPPGVYRVVGVDTAGTDGSDGAVTLLRVGDADARRVNSGEVVTVDTPLAGFEPAADPDGNRSGGAAFRSVLSGSYWSLRAFVTSLAGRPLASGVALACAIAGTVGADALPDPAPTVLILVGALGLAAVGSGRL